MGYLEAMQTEIDDEGHAMPVHMAGVNGIGSEAGNDTFTVGLGLPWLQDTVDEMVWASWNAEHFDLVILDADNVEVAVYNLAEYDLSDLANYEEVKRVLTDMADGQRGAGNMYGNAQHDMAGFGSMTSDAASMHDDMPHDAGDMHGDREYRDMHGDMGHDAGGMPDDMSGLCRSPA